MSESEPTETFSLEDIQAEVDTESPPISDTPRKRRRRQNPFPGLPIEEALEIGTAIQKYASGLKIRRLTLCNHLNCSPDSSSTRNLITNSSRYGLTTGSYSAEWIELTDLGRSATSLEAGGVEKARALFEAGVTSVPVFNYLYEHFKGQRVPSEVVLFDHLKGYEDFTDEEIKTSVEIFLINARYVGVVATITGAERFIDIESHLETLPRQANNISLELSDDFSKVEEGTQERDDEALQGKSDPWGNICFYITPIGGEGTEIRQHADLFMGSIVEPALTEFGLRLVRADKISEGGVITKQIIEYITRSRIVIADLSYHNPNAFYELAWRHATGKPTIQITRASDGIPFDVGTIRTIVIDTSSIYTLIPKLEAYRTAIASQIRRALETPDSLESPFLQYSNDLK